MRGTTLHVIVHHPGVEGINGFVIVFEHEIDLLLHLNDAVLLKGRDLPYVLTDLIVIPVVISKCKIESGSNEL